MISSVLPGDFQGDYIRGDDPGGLARTAGFRPVRHYFPIPTSSMKVRCL
jgi:hypothetical protein